MADALPRERWILAAGALFVVLGGLFPGVIVAQRSAEMDVGDQAIHTPGVSRSGIFESPGHFDSREAPFAASQDKR
jgi:hypothetical protein